MNEAVFCIHCGARLKMPPDSREIKARCPKCKKIFKLPPKSPAAQPPSADPRRLPMEPNVVAASDAAKKDSKSASAFPFDREAIAASNTIPMPARGKKPIQRTDRPVTARRPASLGSQRTPAKEAAGPSPEQLRKKKTLIIAGSAAAAVILAVVIWAASSRGPANTPPAPPRKEAPAPAPIVTTDNPPARDPVTPRLPDKPAIPEPEPIKPFQPDAENKEFADAKEECKRLSASDPAAARAAMESYLRKYPTGKNCAIALREIETLEQRNIDLFAKRYLSGGVPLADESARRSFDDAVRAFETGQVSAAIRQLESVEKRSNPADRTAIVTVMKYLCLTGIAKLTEQQQWSEADDVAVIGLNLWGSDERMKQAVLQCCRTRIRSLVEIDKLDLAIAVGERGISTFLRFGGAPPELVAEVKDLKEKRDAQVIARLSKEPLNKEPLNVEPAVPDNPPSEPKHRPRPPKTPPTPEQPAKRPPMMPGRTPSGQKFSENYLKKIGEEIGWKEGATDHVRLLTNAPKQETLDELKTSMEGIYTTAKDLFKPKRDLPAKITIVVHKSMEDLAGHGGDMALLLPTSEHEDLIVAFVEDEIGIAAANRLAGLHLFDLIFVGEGRSRADIPAWFREGTADSFASSVVEKDKFAFDTLKSVLPVYYLSAIGEGAEATSVTDLLNYDIFQFERASLKARATAWAFCYFLRHQHLAPKGNKAYETVLARLADAVREGKSRKESYDAAFGKIDYEKLNKEFLAYLRRMSRTEMGPIAQQSHVDYLKKQGWKETETKHYRLLTNADSDAILPFMAKRMETMFKAYAAAFKPAKTTDRKAVVIIHDSLKDYTEHGGPPGSAAYYNTVSRVLVGYVEDDWDKVLNYFYHEGTHQFFDLAFPEAFGADPETGKERIPTWFSEGIADCIGASRVEGETVFFNSLNSALGNGRLMTAKALIGRIPLRKLLNYNKEQFYEVAGEAYPLAWSFCYFLWNYPDKSGRGDNNGQLKWVIVKLVDMFKAGKSKEEAYDAVFKKLNLEELEKEWEQYINDLMLPPDK